MVRGIDIERHRLQNSRSENDRKEIRNPGGNFNGLTVYKIKVIAMTKTREFHRFPRLQYLFWSLVASEVQHCKNEYP